MNAPTSGHEQPVYRPTPVRRVKNALRRVDRSLDAGHGLVDRRLPRAPEPATVVCVYRRRNAGYVHELVAGASDVRLWALDEVDPGLQHLTLGSGPGPKFALVHELLTARPLVGSLVVADDDFSFVRGSVAGLLAVQRLAGFQVAQPAHHERVNAAHPITVRRSRTVARRTHFVEIGPVFSLTPPAVERFLSTAHAGMGWGLEAVWGGPSLRGDVTIGIVDHVTIRHHGRIAVEYDRRAAEMEQAAVMGTHGVADLHDLMLDQQRWPVARRRPPW